MKKFNVILTTGILLFFLLANNFTFAQSNKVVFDLMERKDLKLSEIERQAKEHFKKIDITKKGSGYKQFQRWLYEMQFHTDKNGMILPYDYDWKAYQQARQSPQLRSQGAQSTLTDSWTEMGPWSITTTSSWAPGVGRITSIAVDPSNNSIIYVTSPGGGVWKTATGGAGQWTALTDDDATRMNMYSVAIDPLNTQTVYAGSNAGVIIKSTDGGSTWVNTGTGPTGNIWKILPHPSTADIVLVAANNGIFRSTNGGTSWSQVQATNKHDIEFKPGDPNIVYASGTTDVQRSSNGGVSWTVLGSGQGITNTGRSMIGVSPADPNRVYIVQANGSEFGRMYKSTDGGVSFVTTVVGSAAQCTNYFGYNDYGTTNGGCSNGGQATYDMAITVNPTNANEVLIGGIIIWKSVNAGTSFTLKTTWDIQNNGKYTHCDMHALEYIGNTIYSGSDGGIYKSTNAGDTWNDLSSGLGIRQFYRMANSKTNAAVFTGGAQDNGSSVRNSGGWIEWLGADGMDCLVSPTDANLIWGTSQNGGIYRTINGGQTKTDLTKPAAGEWVTPLAIEANTNVIYGGWDDVYKSTNNGTSWTNISGNNISTTLSVLALAPSNPAYIYASKGTTLHRTTNGGGSWTNVTAPGTITSIAVHPTNPLKIWITCNTTGANRVAVSTNGGTSFTDISANLPAIAGRSVIVDDDAAESVYVGMNIGVYYLNNTMGGQWTEISDNIPRVAINEVEIQKSTGKLRIASYGRGVWERPMIGAGTYPTVSITAPLNNATFTAGSNITINATASDADGSVTKVEFFQGSTLLGEDLTAPYSFTWNNVPDGSYSLTAKATDDGGLVMTSTVINIAVNNPAIQEPIAFYKFDNNTNDVSGYNRHAINTGITFQVDPVRGENVGVFNNNSFADIATGSSSAVGLPIRNMTVSGWVKTNTADTWGGFIGNLQDDGSTENGWLLGTVSNKFSFALKSVNGSAMTYLADVATFTTGQWYFVTATYDGITMKLYVNGQLKSSSTEQVGDIAYPSTGWFTIGRYKDANEDYRHDGSLDEIKLFERALSAQEVLDLYNGPGNQPPTVSLPVADAYVLNGNKANTNYGTATTLMIRKDGSSNARESYARFNYSSFTGTTAGLAKLRVYVSAAGSQTSKTISVYGLTNETWGETTITWNNKPTAGTLLGTITMSSATNVWYELDVTSYINSQMSDKIVSFRLVNEGATTGTTTSVTMNSREASSNKPELVITQPAPVAPVNEVFTKKPETVSNEVLVFPNPANGQTNMSFYSHQKGIANISLLGIDGRIILSKTITVSIGYNQSSFDVQGLRAGTYMLRLQNGNSITNKKVIVIN